MEMTLYADHVEGSLAFAQLRDSIVFTTYLQRHT